MGSQSQDAAATSVCTTGYRNDCVAMTLTSTPAMDGALDLSAIADDGFTCIVDDQAPVSITVFWEAWGGSDLTQAAIGEIAEPAATGTQDIVAGFNPDVVLFAGVQGTAAANTATRNDAALMVGAASGPGTAQNIVCVSNEDDASGTSDTDGYCVTGECLAQIAVAGGNPNARAQLTAWLDTGFRLNWIARATTNRRYMFLAMQGGRWAVGAYTIAGNSGGATTTVLTAPNGVPFRPVGISFMGRMAVEQAAGTSATQGRLGLGSATSTSSRRAQGGWSENGNSTADEIDTILEYDSCLAFPSATGTLAASVDINAVNPDGFEVIVDTAGGVASEWQGYVACGSGRAPTVLNNYQFVRVGEGMSTGERIR
jgi:hypothetical protein